MVLVCWFALALVPGWVAAVAAGASARAGTCSGDGAVDGEDAALLQVAGSKAPAALVEEHLALPLAQELRKGTVPPPTTEVSWFCYEYTLQQDAAWCARTPRLGNLQLRYSATSAGPCGSACECCARAASRVTGADSPPPPPPGRNVHFVTAETRKKEVELWLLPGIKPKNVGYGRPESEWHLYKLFVKILSYKEYLSQLVTSDPTRLVVLLDTDIGWGGCSEEELLDRYHAIVEASGGATVVSGAEAQLFPRNETVQAYFERLAEERRGALFRKLGLDLGAWEAFMPGDRRPHPYVYLNSGFLMGPAKDLKWYIDCASKHPFTNDQPSVQICSMLRPGGIALDYTSLIVTDYARIRNNLIHIQGNRIVNNLNGQTQCFVHANGVQHGPMKRWLPLATETLWSRR